MLQIFLAALLLQRGGGLPIAVDTRAQGQGDAEVAALQGAIVSRLLEGGEVIASETSVDEIALLVRVLRHSVLIEASYGPHMAMAEIDRGVSELLRLEVTHAVVDVVHRLQAKLAGDESFTSKKLQHAPRVALRFVGFEPESGQVAAAALALIQAGFEIVGDQGAADWTLCVWRVAGQASSPQGAADPAYVVAPTEVPPCSQRPTALLAPGESLSDQISAEARTVAAQRTVALADEVEGIVETAEPEPPPPRTAARSASAAPTPKKAARRPAWLEIRADGGAQFRFPGIDGAFNVAFGGGRGLWGGSLRAEIVPIGPVEDVREGDELDVFEASLQAGPSLGAPLASWLRLRGYLLGGIVVHRSVWGGRVSHDVDLAASLPLVFDAEIWAGLGFHLGASIGVSQGRRHVYEDDESLIWERGSVRLSVFAGFNYRIELPRRRIELPRRNRSRNALVRRPSRCLSLSEGACT